jgi:hypothetical protein
MAFCLLRLNDASRSSDYGVSISTQGSLSNRFQDSSEAKTAITGFFTWAGFWDRPKKGRPLSPLFVPTLLAPFVFATDGNLDGQNVIDYVTAVGLIMLFRLDLAGSVDEND